MMNLTNFGSPKLDTPISIYELFETCLQICEKKENQRTHRLTDGAAVNEVTDDEVTTIVFPTLSLT